jgi:putative ABC transport system permease protein
MVIRALDRKLVRDLLAMKGQALAISMVVAAGISVFVMYLSNFQSLRETQRAYYERSRFGDVFVSLKRAPRAVAREMARLPGVSAVEARIVTGVTLDLPGLDRPASGQLISIPADRRPIVNDLFLRRGRWVLAGRSDEILASEGFVTANNLQPGDAVPAIVNGHRQLLRIVGVALSPEYVYSIPPGELVPDDRRYGIFWMDERALAAAVDMVGGFNDASLKLTPGLAPDDVLARLDRLLEPYGGAGAVAREHQISHWMLQSELAQLQSFGFLLPLVFLLVAAFTLNVALTRMLARQRPQIAALKALGYGNRAIGWHYVKWALVIGVAGVILGVGIGGWLGSAIGALYNRYFRFPALIFYIPPGVVMGATLLTAIIAGAGALTAVRRAVRVPPAEAMRPEAPARYRRGIGERWFGGLLGTAGRMVIRNMGRHPFRVVSSVFGIGLAVAVLMVGLVFTEIMDRLIVTEFSDVERQDVSVTFTNPRGSEAQHALARLPGVLAVEPVRTVAVRVRAGHRERHLVLTGVAPSARLHRVLDAEGRAVRVPPAGVVMSKALSDTLGVGVGGPLRLEVLEGARPIRVVTVAGLVDDVFGLSIYMDSGALHALMREGAVSTGARLLSDDRADGQLARALKDTPGVGGASFKAAVVESFRQTMASNMNLTIFINVLFASVIAFGVVYNTARVSLSERAHELASLRVLGFTRAEISLVLMGELAMLTVTALPAGVLMGYLLAAAILQTAQSELYRLPLVMSQQAVAWACLGILAAALVSGLLVRRRLDRLDLVAVLKVRE